MTDRVFGEVLMRLELAERSLSLDEVDWEAAGVEPDQPGFSNRLMACDLSV